MDEMLFGQHEDVLGLGGESVLEGFGLEGGSGESSEDLSHCLFFVYI